MLGKTFFPFSTPRHTWGAQKIVGHILSGIVGQKIVTEIGQDHIEMTIVSIKQVEGGLEIITEIEE